MAGTWRKKVPPLIPLISVVFGAIVLLWSFIYMFGALGLQTDAMSANMDMCKESPSKDASSEEKKAHSKGCGYLMEVVAAGVMGCLFGICQVGLSAWMFMKKNILRLWKVWLIASIVLFVFMFVSGCLVFHIFDKRTCAGGSTSPGGGMTVPMKPKKGKQGPPSSDDCTLVDEDDSKKCFRHLGCNQLSVGGGNFVTMFYGLLTFFNGLFLLSSGIMVYLIAKNIDVPIQSIAASLMDSSQPAAVDSKAASKAPSKVTQKASQTKPSSSSMKK